MRGLIQRRDLILLGLGIVLGSVLILSSNLILAATSSTSFAQSISPTPILTIKDLEIRRLKALSIIKTNYDQVTASINKYYLTQENLLK